MRIAIRVFGVEAYLLKQICDTVTLSIVTFTISKVTIDRGENATPIYDDANIRRTS